MKTITIIAFFVVATTFVQAQKPKQHVFYDTVKTVQTRVDYSPDTIPVFFKELVISRYKVNQTSDKGDTSFMDASIAEHWVKGFVVWQTYRKSYNSSTIQWSTGSMDNERTLSSGNELIYYKEEYPEATLLLTDIFLYADRKTKVTNKVIFAVKR